MQVFRQIEHVGRRFRRPTLTLGSFDGVHRGHQAILGRALQVARDADSEAVALTFEPHPAAVLSPAGAPPRLTDWRCRMDRIASTGIHATIVERFTRRFSSLTAEDFVRRYLVESLNVGAVVVGHRVTFGHQRAGDADTLRNLGGIHGFAVEIVGPVRVGGVEVSSSAIREAISRGDLRSASEFLGTPPVVAGRVVRGDQRGRVLGFRTANILTDGWALPPDGVFAVEAVWAGGVQPAVANLGVRPTFDGTRRLLEVHLLNWDGDLYGNRVEVHFRSRLRGEVQFDGPGALIEQIKRDIDAARGFLSGVKQWRS